MQRFKPLLLILVILGVASFFRFYGLNWDQGQGLHPDERFLAMVTNDGKLPPTFAEYLDPVKSTLNPYNYNFGFFVYGTFPISLNKFLIGYFYPPDYGHIFLFGRILSAIFDLSTLLAVFLIGKLIARHFKLSETFALWAAFAYGLMVVPIQQSHFFTTDTFFNAFSTWALYFALRAHFSRKIVWILPCAVFWGLALACKISALYILPLILALAFIPAIESLTPAKLFTEAIEQYGRKLIGLLAFIALAYVMLKLGDPRFFAQGGILNAEINPKFVENIRELQRLGQYGGGIPYPPAVQWIGKPDFWFAFVNIFMFGLGIIPSCFAIMGLFFWRHWKSTTFLLILFWSICFFSYQSTQFAKSIRYFYPLYPFFALLISHAICRLLGVFHTSRAKAFGTAVIALALLIWPEMFRSIYKQEHTRVEASRWIYNNIQAGTLLGNIHWDDPLPIHLPDQPRLEYRYVELGVFGPDDEVKWQPLEKAYSEIDYMILSSNRGYGSMMPLPKLFPRTSKFYGDLFEEKLAFKKVAEITAFPTLNVFGWKFSLDDQWSEEAFTVYDHPVVTIFKRTS